MSAADANAAPPAFRRGLPGECYFSPDIFARARQNIFASAWTFAAHASRLQNPGDFAAVPAGGGIFVLRGDDRKLRAFFNVCRHRGHPLLPEGCGTRGRNIVCPYHSWTYDFAGHLRGARNLDKVAGVRRDDIRLAEARAESLSGFVFVNPDPAAPSLRESFPGVEEAVREFCPDIDERVFALEHSAEEHCNWLAAVENYNECYHCKVAHPDFSRGVVEPESYNIRAFGGGKCLRHSARAAAGDGAWTRDASSAYASFFLWPSFSLQIYPGGIINTYHWQPLSATNTRVVRGWYARPGEETDAHLQKIADLDRDTTFAEDLKIVRRVQRGMEHPAYVPGPLVLAPEQGIDSEHSIAALHDWFLEGVGEGVAG